VCFLSVCFRSGPKTDNIAPLIKKGGHHHHQPIIVPIAGAQIFLMDYPQGERAITHHAGPVRVGGK
jgi:hypothetical protein